MIKKNLKRIVALFLAVLMCCSVFVVNGINAFAETGNVYMTKFPKESNTHWGRLQDHEFLNSWKMPGRSTTNSHWWCYALNSKNGQIAYCIEPGINLTNNTKLTKNGESLLDAYEPWSKPLTKNQLKEVLGTVLTYGYQGNLNSEWSESDDNLAWAIATQLHVWETIVGERNYDYSWNNPSDKGKDWIWWLKPDDPRIESKIDKHYYEMQDKIKADLSRKLPDIKQPAQYEWVWNESGKYWETTLYDYNGVLNQFNLTSPTSGVTVTTNGYNTITVKSKTPEKHTVQLHYEKKAKRCGVVCWSDGKVASSYSDTSAKQDLVTMTSATISHNIKGDRTFGVDPHTTILLINKTSEDGNVAGITFNISGNGVNINRKTDEYGEIEINELNPGTYTVTESTPSYYETQQSKTVTLVANKRATVEFNNVLKKGDVEVIKTADDNFVEGIQFVLSGESTSGEKINLTSATDANGIARFNNVLIGNYTITELRTGKQYKAPAPKSAAVEWNTVTKVKFHNDLKTFKVHAEKVDSENTKPLGDASLIGATYEFHREFSDDGEDFDIVVGTYTTDANAAFTTKEVPVSGKYYIVETDPSTGYLKNDTKFYVFDSADTQSYADWEDGHVLNVFPDGTDLKLPEDIIMAPISIHKYFKPENGTDADLVDEQGAEFQIYLKSAGSYDKASDAERDTIVTGVDGIAKTKDLPYGTYVIHQTKTPNNKTMLADDVEVMVTEDGVDVECSIVNLSPEAVIIVEKLDAETNKVVKMAGAKFQIYRADDSGNLVKDAAHLITVDGTSEFATDVNGKLITPTTLVAGKYFLIETQAPAGYKLDKTPVEFEINTENFKTETINGKSVKVLYVSKSDAPQKGRIAVYKQGEIFKTVQDGTTPVFETGYLSGAEFKVVANKDIVTADGTVRAKKGDVVATLTTDENGKAVTDLLYIGEYAVIETKAPAGYVLDTTPHIVEVTYDADAAANELDLNDTNVFVQDARQKIQFDIAKQLEKDAKIKTGDIDFTVFVFTLFAGEDLVANDGSVIPEGTPLEIMNLDENGKLTFTVDLPYGFKYYVEETNSDVHYTPLEDKIEFEFSTDDRTIDTMYIKKDILNTLKRGKIVGHKYGEVDGSEELSPVAGAVFGLFYEDCTEFIEENAIMTATSDENGEFVFDGVGFGKHIVAEISAPEGYVLNEETFEINIEKNNQVETIDVLEKLIRGTITVLKIDEDYPDHKLSGATFEVYKDVNGNEELDEEDVLYKTLEEVEEGLYELKDVAYGHYLVKETVAPVGFIADEKYYPVFVEENEAVYNVENNGECFINAPKEGTLHLVKTSSDKNVAGFTFNIHGISESGIEINIDVVTDENGSIDVSELRTGTYTITEVANEMTERYVLPDSQEITINEGETTEVSFFNKVIRGKIVITKTDVVTGAVVPGALIEIIDKDGNVIASGRTDDNGQVEFELDYGTYYFKESEAPEGYILDETPHEFTISEDGQIIKAEMTNKAVEAAPKTGTEIATILTVAIALSAILGGVVVLYTRRKRSANAQMN